jgi:hypothetical protein
MKANPALLLAICIGLLGAAQTATAANGVSASKLTYQSWSQGKPNAQTLVSGVFDSNSSWMFVPFNVSWAPAGKQDQIEPASSDLCKSISPGADHGCTGSSKPILIINELFAGDAKDFKPSGQSTVFHIGPETLSTIPEGAKQVLHLQVIFQGQPREIMTISFDETPIEVLRTVSIEEGIYRVMRWKD